MKKLISILSGFMLLGITLMGCTAIDPMIDDIYTQNVYPSDNVTYDLGSTTYTWDDGYFDNLYVGGAAVGGGLETKAGSTTTDANGAALVAFATAYSDTNYSIQLTCADPGDTAIAMYSNKAVGGFDIKTEDDGGVDEPNVTVDWVAVAYGET